MLNRTLQEWSDFLGLKIVCFKTGDNTYEYRGIDYFSLPFSSSWLQYLPETNKTKSPETFYLKYRWLLTKVLASKRYDTVFIPTNLGKINCLKTTKDNKHIYVTGNVESLEDTFLIPITATKWDKNIYVPSYYTLEEDSSDNIEG